MKQDFIENEIIILTKKTLDSFLGEKNPADLIGLYTFYYYTAKWQKTNQPRCNTAYAAKGMRWGKDKTIAVKKRLVEMGLIEDIKDINQETGKVKGWYVKINYLWKENHTTGLPEGGLSQRVAKSDTNALSDYSLNAFNESNEMLVHFLEEWKKITGEYPKDSKLDKIKNFNALFSKAKKNNVNPLDALKYFWNMNGRKDGEYFYYYRQGNLRTMIKLWDLLPKYIEKQKGFNVDDLKTQLAAQYKTNEPRND